MVIAADMATQKKGRVYLSLEKKVEIIKHTQSNPGLSLRSLEIIFGCGKRHRSEKFSRIKSQF